jgi:hypothetical protein
LAHGWCRDDAALPPTRDECAASPAPLASHRIPRGVHVNDFSHLGDLFFANPGRTPLVNGGFGPVTPDLFWIAPAPFDEPLGRA